MDEERGFLTAIMERPDDDATKLVYADWLEERGDSRAEFLRLLIKTRQERAISPEQRQRHQDLSSSLAQLRSQEWQELQAALGTGEASPAFDAERQQEIQEVERALAELSREIRQSIPTRLQELAANLDPNWLAVVGDSEIEGCGKGTSNLWRPRFEFICDKTWADLEPTNSSQVRHCGACSKNVHFCDNIADARQHAQAGHCICCGPRNRSSKGGPCSSDDVRWPTKQGG